MASFESNKDTSDIMSDSEFNSLKKTRYFTIAANTLIHGLLCVCTSWYPIEVAQLIFAEALILIPAIRWSTPRRDLFNPGVIFVGGVSGAVLACHGYSMLKMAEHVSLLATTVVAMVAKTTIATNIWLCGLNVSTWAAFWLTHTNFICSEEDIKSGCQKDCKPFEDIVLFFCSIVIAVMNSVGLITYRNKMISDLRKANKSLAESLEAQAKLNVELQRLLEVRESFILKFSHELRNPLNSIIGNVELAMLEKLPESVSDQLMNAKVSGEQLLQIINNILDSGKLEVSSLDINPLRCRIDTYLESFWAVASSLIKSKGLYGELVIDSHFPKYIQIDQVRVTQILMNLVGNAIKFTNNGRVIIKISFEVGETLDEKTFNSESIEHPDDDCLSEKKVILEPNASFVGIKKPNHTYMSNYGPTYKLTPKKKNFNQEVFRQSKTDLKGFLRIEVIDTGCGMVEEQLLRVFEKFSQFHEEATKRKIGTGLGLWITKELCHIMGGDVRVKSLPHVGTSFIACIQATADSTVELQHVAQKTMSNCSTAPSLTNLNHLRVIVVDDIEYNREVNKKMLNKYGVEDVLTASNGKEVVQLYKKSPPNHFSAILMDLDMPEMDGQEASAAIRLYETQHGLKNVPIIIITGHASDQIKNACLNPRGNVRANKFIVKPLMMSTLQSILRDLTDFAS